MELLIIAVAILFIGFLTVAANEVGVDDRFEHEPTGIA